MREYLKRLKEKQDHQYPVRIIFVCTANCCRSPLAEILFEHILIKKLGSTERIKNKNLIIESAATTYSGLHMAPDSQKVLIGEEGVARDRCQMHVGRHLDEIDEPDLVLTMTKSHVNEVIDQKPRWFNRVFALPEFVSRDMGRQWSEIADPVGGVTDEYRQMKDQVKECLNLLYEEFNDAGLI